MRDTIKNLELAIKVVVKERDEARELLDDLIENCRCDVNFQLAIRICAYKKRGSDGIHSV